MGGLPGTPPGWYWGPPSTPKALYWGFLPWNWGLPGWNWGSPPDPVLGGVPNTGGVPKTETGPLAATRKFHQFLPVPPLTPTPRWIHPPSRRISECFRLRGVPRGEEEPPLPTSDWKRGLGQPGVTETLPPSPAGSLNPSPDLGVCSGTRVGKNPQLLIVNCDAAAGEG